MSDDVSARRSVLAALVLFAAIGGLILTDLLVDYCEGVDLPHLAVEFCVLLVAASGIALLWRELRQSRLDLARIRGEAERWRDEHQQLLTVLAGRASLSGFFLEDLVLPPDPDASQKLP